MTMHLPGPVCVAACCAPACGLPSSPSAQPRTRLAAAATLGWGALLVWALALPAASAAQPAGASSVTRGGVSSGLADMSAALQAMQREDTRNPGMLWVADGQARWQQRAGAADKSCAHCHGEASTSMRGVAARYPAFDTALGKPLTLAQRLAHCRTRHQQASPLPAEGEAALGLLAYVALQSRGQAVAVQDDPRLLPWRQQGQRLYQQRMGQLDLSCAQCHDQRAGQRLGGTLIPQGHANGYPLYRLEWQGLGSLQRRIRNCTSGVRAEAFADDADELTALELYLQQRAAGLVIETPAVRP